MSMFPLHLTVFEIHVSSRILWTEKGNPEQICIGPLWCLQKTSCWLQQKLFPCKYVKDYKLRVGVGVLFQFTPKSARSSIHVFICSRFSGAKSLSGMFCQPWWHIPSSCKCLAEKVAWSKLLSDVKESTTAFITGLFRAGGGGLTWDLRLHVLSNMWMSLLIVLRYMNVWFHPRQSNQACYLKLK